MVINDDDFFEMFEAYGLKPVRSKWIGDGVAYYDEGNSDRRGYFLICNIDGLEVDGEDARTIVHQLVAEYVGLVD